MLRQHSSARRKSARATGASGCSSWRSPQAHDVHPGDSARGGRYGTEHGGRNLTDEASLWPSPAAHDGRRPGSDETSTQGANLKREAELWQTPSVADADGGHASRSREREGELLLPGQAKAWATPKAAAGIKPSAGKRTSSDLSHQAQTTQGGRGSSKPTLGSRQPSKRLCPAFVEWLMGWPVGWSLPCAGALTTFGSSETESSGSPLHRPSLNSGGR